MPYVRTLLFGTTAALAMFGSAEAADIPAKVKPVEYVKICSVYGAGYFYIPGTDTCIKIGGYARFDASTGVSGAFTPVITAVGAKGYNGPGAGNYGFPFVDDDDNNYATHARALFDMDARTKTDYGTLRSFIRFGLQWDSQTAAGAGPGTALWFERAFIQFAGFTFGHTQSFFDIGVNWMMTTPISTTSAWTNLAAYTAQLGNGFSVSLSLEDAARRTIGVQGTTAVSGGLTYGSVLSGLDPFITSATGNTLDYSSWQAGQQAPDIVANLRLDQEWGTVQVSGALHQVGTLTYVPPALYPGPAATEQWGWAASAAANIQLPFIAKGDGLLLMASYADGAVRYTGTAGSSSSTGKGWGSVQVDSLGNLSGGYIPLADAVRVDALGNYDTVKAWALLAQFRHYWSPTVRSALFAGYNNYDPPASSVVDVTGASLWQTGGNITWSPVKGLDLGVEAFYSRLESDIPLQQVGSISTVNGVRTSTSILGGSAGVWSGGFRAQRNF